MNNPSQQVIARRHPPKQSAFREHLHEQVQAQILHFVPSYACKAAAGRQDDTCVPFCNDVRNRCVMDNLEQ